MSDLPEGLHPRGFTLTPDWAESRDYPKLKAVLAEWIPEHSTGICEALESGSPAIVEGLQCGASDGLREVLRKHQLCVKGFLTVSPNEH